MAATEEAQCTAAAVLALAGCLHGVALTLPLSQPWDFLEYKRSRLNNLLVSLVVVQWLWGATTLGLEAFSCSELRFGTGVMITNHAQYLNNIIAPAILASVGAIQGSRLKILSVSQRTQHLYYGAIAIFLIGNWVHFNLLTAKLLDGASGNFMILEALLNFFFFGLSLLVLSLDLLITRQLWSFLSMDGEKIHAKQRRIIRRQIMLSLTPLFLTIADLAVWTYFGVEDGLKLAPIGNALDALLNMATLLSAFHLCANGKYYTAYPTGSPSPELQGSDNCVRGTPSIM